MSTQRLNLNSRPIKDEPLGGDFAGTFYSWDPTKRVLDIFYYGVHQEQQVAPEVVGVLVREEEKHLKMIELRPPRNPVALVAFNNNFFRPRRALSVSEARAAATLAQKEEGGPPLVVECKDAVFVFARRPHGCGHKLIPFRWAAEKGADPVEIVQKLSAVISAS